jgi:hypothetical protein
MFDCATMKTFTLHVLFSTDLPPIRPGNTPGRDPVAIYLGRDPLAIYRGGTLSRVGKEGSGSARGVLACLGTDCQEGSWDGIPTNRCDRDSL